MGLLKIGAKILGSSVFRNIKSKVGGVGKMDNQAIAGDVIIDIVKLIIIGGIIIYALKTGDFAGAENAKDLLGN